MSICYASVKKHARRAVLGDFRTISRRTALRTMAALPAIAAGGWRGRILSQPVGASVNGIPVFPPDNPWNTDISAWPLDPNSDALIASIGLTTGLHPDFGTVY